MFSTIVFISITLFFVVYYSIAPGKAQETQPARTIDKLSTDTRIIDALQAKQQSYIELACTCENDAAAISDEQDTLYDKADKARATNNMEKWEKLTKRANSLSMKTAKLQTSAANARLQAAKMQKQIDRIKERA